MSAVEGRTGAVRARSDIWKKDKQDELSERGVFDKRGSFETNEGEC